jgi:hypothetical protein
MFVNLVVCAGRPPIHLLVKKILNHPGRHVINRDVTQALKKVAAYSAFIVVSVAHKVELGEIEILNRKTSQVRAGRRRMLLQLPKFPTLYGFPLDGLAAGPEVGPVLLSAPLDYAPPTIPRSVFQRHG